MSDTVDIEAAYKNFSGPNAEPLEPDHRFYVPIHESRASDPIRALETRLRFASSESVNLLTGFRGNGKSTELRRLKRLLEDAGCKVFLINMLDFVFMTEPVELSDFTLSLMAALAEAVENEDGLNQVREGYLKRLGNFLQSEVVLEGGKLGLKDGPVSAEIGARLKTDATFKQMVQKQLRGQVTRLIKDAQGFVLDVVKALRERYANPDLKAVLLVDSMEQLRGWAEEAPKVYESAVELFSGQAVNLAYPTLHVVYTVPPYLTAVAGNVSRVLGGNPIVSWPNVHVRKISGEDDDVGMTVMETIVEKRFPDWQQVFSREHLRRLARSSGGDLRDYFRLVRECLVELETAGQSQVDEAILRRVEQQLRSELTPLAAEDVRWLCRIHQTKSTALESNDELHRLARFLDGNWIMNYQNGEPWYDVHPLIVEELERAEARE